MITEISQKQNIFLTWLFWHFFEIPKEILKALKNYLVFLFNYFSIPILLKTLFSHWRRYRESYGKGFDLKRFFSALTFNLISRILGAIVRIITIFIWLIAEFFVLIGFLIILLFWLILPFLGIIGIYWIFSTL